MPVPPPLQVPSARTQPPVRVQFRRLRRELLGREVSLRRTRGCRSGDDEQRKDDQRDGDGPEVRACAIHARQPAPPALALPIPRRYATQRNRSALRTVHVGPKLAVRLVNPVERLPRTLRAPQRRQSPVTVIRPPLTPARPWTCVMAVSTGRLPNPERGRRIYDADKPRPHRPSSMAPTPEVQTR